jgi:hypothetical protein
MRPLRDISLGFFLLAAGLAAPAGAVECTSDDIAKSVNDAGAALRKLSADNTPRLQAKMAQLKTKMKWPEVGFEERAYQALQDERVAALDADANGLLAKIDALGTVDQGGVPDCSKLQELEAASLELQATVKTKTQYLISKLDQMLSDAPIASAPRAKAPEPAPKTELKPPPTSSWSTRTTGDATPAEIASAKPLPGLGPLPGAAAGLDEAGALPAPADTDGYTIEEIRAASAGFFGQVSANLGSVIEHIFRKSGRPTGYILGTEGGGAFLAGVRYGDGTLYLRSGGTQKVYWHGPSVGADVGGAGSKTLFLIYKLKAPEELYSNFTGIDGSAYLVGGVGATLVTNGGVVMAPIRSGIGLRLGASVGYLRFTPKATWNPF